MNPQSLDLDAFTAGDHFPGIPLIRVREDGVPPVTGLSSARLRFVPDDRRVKAAVELASTSAEISISIAEWEISVPVQPVAALTAGLWRYNLETTDGAGTVATPMTGHLRVRGAHDPEPAHFTLETITAGDHFPGIPEVTITVNGESPATTVAVAELTFSQPGKTPVVISSANAKVTLPPRVIYSPIGTPENDAVEAFDFLVGDPDYAGTYRWNGTYFEHGYPLKQFFTREGDSVTFDAGGLEFGSGSAFYGSVDDEDYVWSLHSGLDWDNLFPSTVMTTTEERPSPVEVLYWTFDGLSGPVTFENIQWFYFTVGQFCRVGAEEPYSWFQWNGMVWEPVEEGPAGGGDWVLSVPAQAIPGLTAGKWLAKLRTQDSAGVWRTWFSADQTVLADV